MTAETSNNKQCDLCDGTDFEKVSDSDRHGRPLGTVICRTCGLVAHEDIPSEEVLAKFYATDYRREYHGELTPSARRVMRAWNNGQRIYNQVAPFLQQDDRIFEVGAGIGCTVKSFADHGYDAAGCEPGNGFQSYAADNLHVRISGDGLFDLPTDGDHNLVLLVHVIEHFRSPRAALQQIRKMLPTGGRFYVECPNLTAPLAPFAKMFHFAHIHNFTPATLQMLAARCGFRLVERFSSDDDPNLQALFEAVDEATWELDRSSYERTMAEIHRHNILTYHARPGYLASRARKVAGYVNEHVSAIRFVDALTRQTDKQTGPADETEDRRAA